MRQENKTLDRILKGIYHFFCFFLIVAFVVTSSTMLFINVFSEASNIEITSENISAAAKLTFINSVIISIIFTVIDSLRRKLTTERSAKYVSAAAGRMAKGDFEFRIVLPSKFAIDESYLEIIDCFNTLAEELEGVETLRSDFISNVSHEMKTPLAVIKNYCKLLESDELPEEKRKEYVKCISESAQRLSDMITNILKLNKLENQQIYPKSEEYDLSEQLRESLLAFESTWERAGIEIDADIEDDISVTGDRELLSHIWSNLLSNAFKFTEKGGRVSLSLTATAHHATVTVSDTGCGMSAEVGERIFEKFYQGDSSHSTQGNGLGLALVKRVVDIVGGEISVESTLGEGTVFTVKIRRNNNG